MRVIFIVLMIIFMIAMYLNLLKGAKKADIKLSKLICESKEDIEKI